MLLRTILTFSIAAVGVGVWSAAWSLVRTNARARREWHRVVGTVQSVTHPERPTVKVEQGIEFAPPPLDKDHATYDPDERTFELDGDAGLRSWQRVELLVDPVTKRARVARGVGVSAFLLALLGLVYIAVAGGFVLVTSGLALEPGDWAYYQSPPWHEPALISARFSTWPILERALGALIGLLGAYMVWTSPATGLARRAAIVYAVLLLTGFMAVTALGRITYRLEADNTGLRQHSALGWQMTRWEALRHGVDETTRWMGRRSSRSLAMLDHTSRRIYFTDDQGREVAEIGDNVRPEQAEAMLKFVLARTGVRVEKRRRERELLTHTR